MMHMHAFFGVTVFGNCLLRDELLGRDTRLGDVILVLDIAKAGCTATNTRSVAKAQNMSRLFLLNL
jgi:hypothetical protein